MGRCTHISNDKFICWVLISAILYITFLPAHYHLHHLLTDEQTAHTHSIDLHLITDISAETHHYESTTVVEATPDGIIKNYNSVLLPFLLFATVVLILAVVSKRAISLLDFRDLIPKPQYLHLTPPLRAPPLT